MFAAPRCINVVIAMPPASAEDGYSGRSSIAHVCILIIIMQGDERWQCEDMSQLSSCPLCGCDRYLSQPLRQSSLDTVIKGV